MYKEIDSELIRLTRNLFTGHIRFGIEHGLLTSMQITSKVDNLMIYNESNWKSAIESQVPVETDFYGSIEFNFSFGKLISFNYFVQLQGEQLKKRFEENQCRSVKRVVKTLNT